MTSDAPPRTPICTIYKVTNVVNGKVYVGQTWLSIQDRWNIHLKDAKRKRFKLHNAIRKYGEQSFRIGLLTIAHTQQVADQWERHFIARYDAVTSGYNLKDGGSYGKHSEATKRKLSQMAQGRKMSEEAKQKISAAQMGNSLCKGRACRAETRAKLSDKAKQRVMTPETKAKIAASVKLARAKASSKP